MSASSDKQRLPAVQELEAFLLKHHPHQTPLKIRREIIRKVLDEARSKAPWPSTEELAKCCFANIQNLESKKLRRVINATGVVLHTNLGRAPLPKDLVDSLGDLLTGYTNLEFDLATGERGGRGAYLESLLCTLTETEDSLVVNNCAAAVYLAFSALALGRSAVISRGELVQIGGGFRMPSIMAASGVALCEVGTTNITTIADYRAAFASADPAPAMIVKVHRSNFAIQGHTEEPSLAELSELAHEFSVPVVYDLGSGVLDNSQSVLGDESSIRQAIKNHFDIVCFSGDKLFGGPQSGMIVGKTRWIKLLRQHPFYRALRVGRLVYAALEKVVLAHHEGRTESLPAYAMLSVKAEDLKSRATKIVAQLKNTKEISLSSTPGGGTAPDLAVPSYGFCIEGSENLARRLRMQGIICRISDGQLIFDLRTVAPEDDQALVSALR